MLYELLRLAICPVCVTIVPSAVVRALPSAFVAIAVVFPATVELRVATSVALAFVATDVWRPAISPVCVTIAEATIVKALSSAFVPIAVVLFETMAVSATTSAALAASEDVDPEQGPSIILLY